MDGWIARGRVASRKASRVAVSARPRPPPLVHAFSLPFPTSLPNPRVFAMQMNKIVPMQYDAGDPFLDDLTMYPVPTSTKLAIILGEYSGVPGTCLQILRGT